MCNLCYFCGFCEAVKESFNIRASKRDKVFDKRLRGHQRIIHERLAAVYCENFQIKYWNARGTF